MIDTMEINVSGKGKATSASHGLVVNFVTVEMGR